MPTLSVRVNLPVVLYLDPDAENRQAFEHALLDHARVHAFGDPRTALLALQRMGAVDVVVADLAMPGMNGVEFLTEAAKICPTTTRVIVTALDQAWPVLDAMNRGMVHHCYDRAEAFSPGKLEEIIAEAVEASMNRAFEARLVAVLPELLDRMSEAGDGWRSGLMLARSTRALQIVRLLLPYLDLSVQDRINLLLSGLFCNLAGDVFAEMSEWAGVHAALADCLEMWDGSGPQRKSGDQIPILAQILGVIIGFYNWIMGTRAVSSGAEETITRAIARLETEAGTKYSPEVVEVFLQMVRDKRAELAQIFSA